MQAGKGKSTNTNLQGKLSLKRSNSSSSQSKLHLNTNTNPASHKIDDQEICSNKQSPQNENICKSPDAEDSLADFKSPKLETERRPIISKFKIDSERVKKKIAKTKSKSRKTKSDVKQPSIEVSFLKPQSSNQNEIQESIPCPLCLRPFKDDASCTTHMKTCAAKNKVSVKQLLDAKKLQDRQAEERKAMGLLATPVLPERKKTFRSKKYSTEDDPQLQLMLAMSESLYQAEQMAELEQAAVLAGIPSECIKNMNEEERKTTLQNFGFTSNKPAVEIPINKKRKKIGSTILQTRSKEDKDRVLTERIACILTGDDVLTQVRQNTEEISRDNEPTRLRNENLKKIQKLSDKLWDKSRLTKKCNDFYVKNLKTHFVPPDQQVEQLPTNSQILNIDDDDDATKDNDVLANASIEYEPMEIDVIINEELENQISNLANVNELESMDRELEFVKNLTLKWRDTLDDSAASDLIIYVKNDQHIFVHKLVFHVQCSNILLDIEADNSKFHHSIKEKISWITYEKYSALAFLEFIYCGTIHKNIKIFENDNLLSEVNQLARCYQVPGLFTYLRKRQKESKSVTVKQTTDVSKNMNIQEKNKDHIKNDQPSNTALVQNSQAEFISTNVASVKKLNDRQITESPDLFGSENEEENLYFQETQTNSHTPEHQNNTNLKILVDLINADEKENTDDATSYIQDRNAENISSQKTVVNLSGAPSPQSDISILYSPTRDIHGTITPKNRSPDIANDITPERINSDNEKIDRAVTPKLRLSKRHNEITSQEKDCDNDDITDAITPVSGRSPEMNDNFAFETKNLKNNDISEAKTPEPNTIERLNEYTEPKRPVYVNMDIDDVALNASLLENDNESMYTAVTPPRPNETNCEPQFELTENENIKKPKSDISLFIDKVRRVNARSTLDTDSEIDTPELRKARKNPFLKKYHDDSYKYLQNDGHKNDGQRRVISMLEEDVLKRKHKVVSQTNSNSSSSNASENTKFHNLSRSEIPSINLSPDLQDEFIENDKLKNIIHGASILEGKSDNNFKVSEINKELSKSQTKKDKNETSNLSISDNESHNVTMNESEMSMYSRYKKQNKHDNSIAKYRKELNFKYSKKDISKQANTECNLKADSEKNINISEKPTNVNSMSRPNSKLEDITLVSDSDDEEKDKSSNKKESLKHLGSDAVLANIEDNRAFSSFSVDDNLKPFTASKITVSTIVKEVNSKNNVIDLSTDSDEENLMNIAESSLKSKTLRENNVSEKDKKNKSSEISEHKTGNVLEEINRILQISRNFSDQNENSFDESKKQKECHKDLNKGALSENHGSQCEMINLSPISIISSPELNELDKEKLCKSNTDSLRAKNKNFNKSNTPCKTKIDAFNTIDNEYFKDIDFDDDWILKEPVEKNDTNISTKSSCSVSEKSLTSSNKNISSRLSLKSRNNSEDRTLQMSSLISSPILSQKRQKTRTSDPTKTSQKRTSQSPEEIFKKSRQLQTKSASDNNLSEKSTNKNRCNLQKSSSFVTPDRDKHSSQKVGKCVKDMTPPLDYNLLDTPELHKELKKFGLKPQNRSKAVKLLSHIYNETHPVSVSRKRTSSENSSDLDEEPPLKRQNFKKTCKQNILEEKVDSNRAQSSQHRPVLAEEMEYDEVDATDSLDSPVNIKDAFAKLLKANKELHTKVLTYEPLPLESLHVMLKENGLKCKINALMDFLDEQCITFQVQGSKGNRTKKKERRK